MNMATEVAGRRQEMGDVLLGLSRKWLALLAAATSLTASGSSAQDQPLDRNAFVPVFSVDFPDPFILEHEGRFLAYATNTGSTNVQMAASTNLVDWQRIEDHDAMPDLPPWARE